MKQHLWTDDTWLQARLLQGLDRIIRAGLPLLDAQSDPHALQRVFAVNGLAELRAFVRDESEWARAVAQEPHDPKVPVAAYRDWTLNLDAALSAALALYDPNDAENGYYAWLDAAMRAYAGLADLAESLGGPPRG